MVFANNKLNDTIIILNGLPLSNSNSIKYLGIEFSYNLNLSNFFINKFSSVSKSFYSLNSLGLEPGGSPFSQSLIYKTFCLSCILYDVEIFSVNKKKINLMNISQNNLIRYMTGLSRNSHISNTRKILKILSIDELFKYMKLVFVKNLTNNASCLRIFNSLLLTKYNNNSISFIKYFKDICRDLSLDVNYVFNNINALINIFKEDCLSVEENTETELKRLCLKNNQDYKMIDQLNLVTYVGTQ